MDRKREQQDARGEHIRFHRGAEKSLLRSIATAQRQGQDDGALQRMLFEHQTAVEALEHGGTVGCGFTDCEGART